MFGHEKEVEFNDMVFVTPDRDSLQEEYQKLEDAFANTETPADRLKVLEEWDRVRARFQSWTQSVTYRFTRNTADESAQKDQDLVDELSPFVEGLEAKLKETFLREGQDIEHQTGRHIFDLWKCDTLAFKPEIEADLVKEAKISNEVTALRSKAKFEVDGKSYNLGTIGAAVSDPDRAQREKAVRAKFDYYEAHSDEYQTLYDKLVELRTQKAKKLGMRNFVPLGYLNLRRTDYGENEVAYFRDQIVEHLLPVVAKLEERQRKALNVDKLMAWDRGIFVPEGSPRPQGTPEELVGYAQKMFNELEPTLGDFFKRMRNQDLMDLVARDNKAPGGYCTSIPDYKMPVVFANFNGTKDDVEVLTHEIGHAFQYYSSAKKKPIDYQWPTYEACEIHSMSLEYLTWPYMDLFFGDEAERFRETHLSNALIFYPYGCAIDHFQHLVYENPEASPDERLLFWKEVESRYMPGLDWGGIKFGEKGGMWIDKLHVFQYPFYYIDYCLALTVALQYWKWSLEDPKEALKSYVALCKRGGEAPFQQLVKSTGLRSPFDSGTVEEVVGFAADYLKL